MGIREEARAARERRDAELVEQAKRRAEAAREKAEKIVAGVLTGQADPMPMPGIAVAATVTPDISAIAVDCGEGVYVRVSSAEPPYELELCDEFGGDVGWVNVDATEGYDSADYPIRTLAHLADAIEALEPPTPRSTPDPK